MTDPGHADTVHGIEDPLRGKLVDGRYRIMNRLGEGGMGLVYEARHEVLGTPLAIKVLRSDAAKDAEALERLKREAMSASAIGSKHIVDVRDFGRLPDGSPYVVMEKIDGTDLYNAIRAGRFDWPRAKHVARQIAEALAAAHERGIVHRDLKPENVLLTTQGERDDFVKIVDFGIAKIAGTEKITQAGRVMGTPEYMAPEQCSGHAVDHRADIYALGVLIFEMVTRQLPFRNKDLMELLRMQIRDRPPDVSSTVPEDADLPARLDWLVHRCLAKDRAERFQTMHELVRALDDLEADEALVGADSSADVEAHAPIPTPREVSPPGRKAPLMWAAAFAVLAMVGGVSFGLWMLEPEAAGETLAAVDPAPPAAAAPLDEPAPDPAPLPAAAAEAPALLTLESDPPGARVYRDEGLIGETPLRIVHPEEGERVELVLRAEGYEEHRAVLAAQTGDALRVVLEPLPSRPRQAAPPAEEATEVAPTSPRPPRPETRRERPFFNPWDE